MVRLCKAPPLPRPLSAPGVPQQEAEDRGPQRLASAAGQGDHLGLAGPWRPAGCRRISLLHVERHARGVQVEGPAAGALFALGTTPTSGQQRRVWRGGRFRRRRLRRQCLGRRWRGRGALSGLPRGLAHQPDLRRPHPELPPICEHRGGQCVVGAVQPLDIGHILGERELRAVRARGTLPRGGCGRGPLPEAPAVRESAQGADFDSEAVLLQQGHWLPAEDQKGNFLRGETRLRQELVGRPNDRAPGVSAHCRDLPSWGVCQWWALQRCCQVQPGLVHV
mmetsp:Transcript_31139/g.99199  ORF Transcript_31139/g.99199 Transcript_31139/m.99199 type:complete len:279 (+) Transcript_31139:3-839(+)